MRKLRKAALVAAMVGSISMLGAGAASAQDSYTGDGDGGTTLVFCDNSDEGSLLDLSNLQLSVLGLGSNTASTNQSNKGCSAGDLTQVNAAETEQASGVLNVLSAIGG
ncbi:hypothetical protein [Streptomyces sp. NPDC051219]|uniref:hypothetical protein n=1 Tax=Streptomyces sp. NPDC051219 TaxID=3155283 RepID=UPI00341CFB5A